jgi:hypothetical protein
MITNFLTKVTIASIGAVAMLGAAATISHAATFTEAPDEAGETLGTALSAGTVGTGSLTQFINGQFDTRANPSGTPPYNDVVDLFKITLASNSILTAETLNPGNAPASRINDPVLFLFDMTGKFLARNNDSALGGNGLQALLTSSPLNAGMYYLGITPWSVNPLLDSNDILTGWSGAIGFTNNDDLDQKNINYRIQLGVDAVPTPALLPGLFALGAGALRKRKQQLAGAIA